MAKFETIEALQEWLEDTGVQISDLDVTVTSQTTCTESCELPAEEIRLDESVFSIKSLSTQPSIALYENEKFKQNTWFVDDYEFIPGACGTNKITFNDSTIYINICENNGEAYADLICETNGELKTVKFKLEKSCNNDTEYDMILSP